MAGSRFGRRRRRNAAIALGGASLAVTGALIGGSIVVEMMTRDGDAGRVTADWSLLPVHYLERPDGRIAFDDSGGSGPLVVAIPSLGDLRQEYRFLRPLLLAEGYRLVTVDLRGHGQSSTGWPDYAADAIGGDIVALLEYLDAGPATIIGTSMAAGAAVWAGAAAPNRVAGLTLVGPFVRDLPPSPVQSLMLKVLIRRPWGPAAWSLYYKSLYPTQLPNDLTDYRAALKANLKEPGRFRALQAMLGASKAAVEARLADVEAPVLVVMGSKDPDFPDPAAEARLVAERLNGRVMLIDGAGHYPHVEMPEATAPAILAFLREIRTGTVVAGGR
ncbi:MAG: alpha/beta fold hydrolase [Dehalococcoidia bacterium]